MTEAKIGRVMPKNLVGKTLEPVGRSDGQYGIAVQNEYDIAGIRTNYGEGVDIPWLNREIKTRTKGSWAPMTIGSAKISHIINTNGELFLEKLKHWDYHIFDSDSKSVFYTEDLDMRDIEFYFRQELLSLTKQLIAWNPISKWTLATTDMLVIERTKEYDDRYGKLRIKGNKVDNFIGMVKSSRQFNSLFEYE